MTTRDEDEARLSRRAEGLRRITERAMAEPPDWPEGFTPEQIRVLRPILSGAAQRMRERDSEGEGPAA